MFSFACQFLEIINILYFCDIVIKFILTKKLYLFI